MKYSEFVELYEELSATTKRLEKTSILAEFLKKLGKEGMPEWGYLLFGRVVPDYDMRELGISQQLTIKAISSSYGLSNEKVNKRFRNIGDLGEIAQEFSQKRKQGALFSKKLEAEKVFENLRKIMEFEGKGAVERKIALVSELLASASEKEAKYIIRTLLSDLRIGIAAPTIVEALAEAFFPGQEEASKKIQSAYDMANDFAVVFSACKKGINELDKIELVPGRAINVMLAVKADSLKEAFDACGKPSAIEQKYDGFRLLLNKDKNGEIKLFTRRLEDVTKQFPDVVLAVSKNVKADSFILDSEAVGFDAKTGKYQPFEAVSQRIKRKYGIEKMSKELPVEINVFDCLYFNGKSMINLPFKERRKIVEKIIIEKKLVIRPAVQIITDIEEIAMKFYKQALKLGEEGIMLKNLNAPYRQGRHVGFMCKLKPEKNDLDLVIVGAEYGTGKRGGLLTSYILACRDDDKLLEVGKVSSGLKEKEQEGFTFEQMTKLLKPLIENENSRVVKIKPKIVVSAAYQNIQESPSYSSGFALRFPRITNYRPDRNIRDIVSLDEIKKEVKKAKR